MGAQVSDSVANGVPALRPAEKGNQHSIDGECLAVILVLIRYDSSIDSIILAPGCTNTRSVLPSFETATETITLRENAAAFAKNI